jgi:type I restriction enzyme, S subunit
MIYGGSNRLGDFFDSVREKGRPGLPLLSVTANDGLVERSLLDRKQETNLSAEEHLLVQPGDIAYNTMRMWQGAFGLADRAGLVSPAYVVLRPKRGIDSHYASYLFKTPRMKYLFWAYSYGLTDDRLRLYADDFMRIPVSVPNKQKQCSTASALIHWDQSIGAARKLFAQQAQMHGKVVADLTLGHRRLLSSSAKWQTARLGKLGSTFGGLSGKSKEDFGHGKPFIPYSNIFANTRIDLGSLERVNVGEAESQNICRYGDIFFTGSSETPEELGTASVLLDHCEELYLNSFCVGFRLHDFGTLLPEFARFLFRGPSIRRSLNQLAQGYTRFNLSKSELMKLEVRLPPVVEQEAIVCVLDASEKHLSAISKSIELLRRERTALMQLVLGETNESPIAQMETA